MRFFFAFNGSLPLICIYLFTIILTPTINGSHFLDLIPSRLEGRIISNSIHIVELKVGTPRVILRLALDYEKSGIITPQPYSTHISSTFIPIGLGTGTDEVIVSGKILRLPFTTDPLRVEQVISSGPNNIGDLVCTDCDGLFGVGPSSPLWVVWKEATFSSGAITLDGLSHTITDAARWNHLEIPSQRENFINCDIAFTGLCKTTALVGPNKELNTVIFSFDNSRTLVPPTVFDAYTNGKNIFDTDRDDWPDLEIEFVNLSPSSSDSSSKVRIRNHDIVAPSEIDSNELLIDVSNVVNTTFIGRPAWRSFFIHKNWITNDVRVFNWKVEKSYTWFNAFIMILFSLTFVWWKGTDTGEWTIRYKYRPYRIVASIIIYLIAIINIWTHSIRCSLKGFSIVDAYVQTFIYISTLFIITGLILHVILARGYGKKTHWAFRSVLGLTHAENNALENEIARRDSINNDVNNNKNNDGDNAKLIINYSISDSTLHNRNRRNYERDSFRQITSHYTDYYSNPFLHTREDDQYYNNRSQSHGYYEDYIPLGSQRLWAIVTFSVETILILSLLITWWTTREDTLTGFMSVFIFSLLILNVAYHLFAQMYHRGGYHSAVWYLYLGFMCMFLVLTYLIGIYFIFYPFSIRFIVDYSEVPILFTGLYSVALLYISEELASKRIPKRYYHNI